MAEDRIQHFPCCDHAIAANRMGIELKSQLYVAVAKQRLPVFGSVLIRIRNKARQIFELHERTEPRFRLERAFPSLASRLDV